MKPRLSFEQFFHEATQTRIVLLPGGFKPPHKGHFEALKYLIKQHQATHAYVFIGKSIRDGITAEQSQAIWNIYAKYLPVPVTVEISEVTPVKTAYDFVDKHLAASIAVGAGQEDQDRYGYFNKNKDKYSNVTIVSIPPQFNRLSGTAVRARIAAHAPDATSFVPTEVGVADIKMIKELLGL